MPTTAEAPEVLVDTSAAVALLVEAHELHDTVHPILSTRRCGLAGHAAFETFSVLTRMPPPTRRSASEAALLLDRAFPASQYLSPERAGVLLTSLPDLEVSGGAVYDALVAATAVEHGVTLVSIDRRALPTYRAVGAEVELITPDR